MASCTMAFAVASGKLCPKGWRVPADKDWIELEQFLGMPAAELERTGERGAIADQLKVAEGGSSPILRQKLQWLFHYACRHQT